MNRADDHLDFEQLAVGHALSALEPDEEQRFLAHLATCTRCERDVAEHQATMGHLAYAADEAEPPPSLLEGIRAGVLASSRAPAPAPRAAEPARAPAGAPEDELAAARRRRARLSAATRWTSVAAAATLVVSLAAWNVALRADRDASQARGSRLASAVLELGRPGTESVPLTAEDGQVVAVALMRDGEMSLVVDGLDPNDPGTTYVLWAQAPDGGVSAVGAFDVHDRDLDVVDDLAVGEALDVTALMVSREDGDVAPSEPGGPVFASGEA